MKPSASVIDRRRFLAASASTALSTGVGATAFLGLGTRVAAAEPTAAEKANIAVVNAFCAAWPSHDLDKLMAFFTDDGAYRMTETREPAKGRAAVAASVKSILPSVVGFDVLDTFARGPLVINERVDRFTGFALKSWHGVGVFFLRDGKIAEWYDYTIDMERNPTPAG